MTRLRVHNFSMSLDGYVAGPRQSLEHPLGEGGEALHQWVFPTRFFHEMRGEAGGETGIDDDFARRLREGVGATIMGRNMFGPVRGPWGDSQWTGWWGDDPPYHHPVFVLTHHAHDPIEMAGGTTFHFVTGGILAAREQAISAAGGADVVVGGGAATVAQYLRAGLVDELHLVVVPTLLGDGARLFERVDGGGVGYTCAELVGSTAVAHVRLVREHD
jgi:dihydrofolate reductase